MSHPPGVSRDNRMLKESILHKEQGIMRDQNLKGFLEASYNSGAYKSNRYQSPERHTGVWKNDLYFERVERNESETPLQDQIEDGASA